MPGERSTARRDRGRPAGFSAFRTQLAILVTVYTVVITGGIYFQTYRNSIDGLRAQGESYFELIVHTREWNSGHGGVWVEKSAGVDTNEFLLEMGIPADLEATDGTRLTMRNPAAMMREISDITAEDTGVFFRLVAPGAVNPANLPDDWEAESIERFADGEQAVGEVDRTGSVPVYRYMQPLEVDASCLSCHTGQGYETGDSRGGISITIPMGDVDSRLARLAWMFAGITGVTLAGVHYILNILGKRFERRLTEANEQLEVMATTDGLTGVLNRRATIERLTTEFARARRLGTPLSAIWLDLDRFKQVNDRFGHAAGDAALVEFTRRAQDTIRAYDILGRVGGEEFVIVAPNTETIEAIALAERIVEAVRAEPIASADGKISLTASAGVATLAPEDAGIDSLLGRADDALYVAKDQGRDRVATAE